MGKWYNSFHLPAGNPIKRSHLQKNPLAGSVEEEALVLPIQEKKIAEQEKELMALLNFRFGYGTWDELKEMRPRLQKIEKKKFMPQAELRRNLIEAFSILFNNVRRPISIWSCLLIAPFKGYMYCPICTCSFTRYR